METVYKDPILEGLSVKKKYQDGTAHYGTFISGCREVCKEWHPEWKLLKVQDATFKFFGGLET